MTTKPTPAKQTEAMERVSKKIALVDGFSEMAGLPPVGAVEIDRADLRILLTLAKKGLKE